MFRAFPSHDRRRSFRGRYGRRSSFRGRIRRGTRRVRRYMVIGNRM